MRAACRRCRGWCRHPCTSRKFGGNGDLAGYRNDDGPVPEETGEHYARQLHDLAAAFAAWDDPAVVTLTDDAKRVRPEAANRIERQLRPGEAAGRSGRMVLGPHGGQDPRATT
ncbi:DUF3987 domain-containing protein [Dactylosporangium sp. CA-139114]|uniref:DUF3987 domain-containing protein n=1 Tax=Dactylosporangium sp. CA-139114 TaxID=3239931 RepID=UPI003D982E8A